MSKMPKMLTIKAADLRVGDNVMNYGVVVETYARSGDSRYLKLRTNDPKWPIFETGFVSNREFVIERTEPEVTTRWMNLYQCDLGGMRLFGTLNDTRAEVDHLDSTTAEARIGVLRLTFHDGVLAAAEAEQL